MGPEVNPRGTRSESPFTMRKGLFAFGLIALALSLSQLHSPKLAQEPTLSIVAGQDLTTASPFWLSGIIASQATRPRQRAHATIATPATVAPQLSPVGPIHEVASLTPTGTHDASLDSSHEQSAEMSYLPSEILPGTALHTHTLQAHARIVREHLAEASPRAINNLTTDQQFAATFTDPAKANVGSGASIATQNAFATSTTSAIDMSASALAPTTTQDGHLFNNGSGSDAQIGNVAIHTEALVQHLQATTPIADNRYDAVKLHTSVTVPAFHHPLHLAVGGGYEHLIQPTDGHTLNALDAPPSSNIDDASTTTVSPDVTQTTQLDMARSGYAATASVPVSHHINVGVGYSQSDLHGNGGSTQSGIVDQHQQQYTGAITYAPHNGRSSISLIGRASHATDSLAPTGDTDERRGDLLFSVKF